MNYPKTIRDLIEVYKKFPGVGEKSAERLALATLSFDEETNIKFSDTVRNIKTKIKRCTICNNLTEEELCDVCKDNSRNKKIICVVEDPKNVILFEKIGVYNGLYHVLGGLISPLDGINPENLKIKSLIERVKKDEIEEVILALKPSIEGETTVLYINKLLEKQKIKITKIAHGIPLGADMEYIDSLTLELALEKRTEV